MAIEQIPTFSDPSYTQVTSLSGQDYQLDLDYNARDGVHLLNLSTEEGTLLVGGLALLPGTFLLTGLQVDGLPPGDLIVLSDNVKPALGDFGTDRASLYYVTDDDLIEFRAILAST